MISNALEYYQNMKKSNKILVYCGPIWIVSVEELGETILKRLELEQLSVSASNSIFSVFVEQMNNISLYSAEKDVFNHSEAEKAEIAKGVFVLGSDGDKYFLLSGNAVNAHSHQVLKTRIDYLNSLDRKALRKYYREQLTGDDTNPESRGAGLGLTEIAKRASSKIEYNFTPMENGLTFFTMLVELGGN